MAAKISLSVLSFFLLVAFAASQATWQRGQCDITRINAQEPSYQLKSDGGVSEFWDHNNTDFQCAGVSFRRHTIRPRGLFLPSYHNSPVLVYVLKGRGIFGAMLSGCPETFDSPQQSEEIIRGQKFTDRHQKKLENLKEGDVLAIPAGTPHWAYNSGDQEFIVVVLQDNNNNANKLDQNPRSFFLAGNPQKGQQQQRRYGSQQQQYQHESGNIFQGIDVQTLADVFQTDVESARKLQSNDDSRGVIVIVEKGLHLIRPSMKEEYGRDNGLEETFCTARLKENIDRASRADIYNPRAGRFSTANSFTLPILRFLQLSAAKGVLYKNAMMSPFWYVNAHSICYITRGEGRFQVVNHKGQAVFDGRVQEGQVLVLPQNFVVTRQAGEEGVEWVEFNTNNNAMINTVSGRISALRGLPVDVISNAYQMSREQAERLKFSRQEMLLFSGRSSIERVASA